MRHLEPVWKPQKSWQPEDSFMYLAASMLNNHLDKKIKKKSFHVLEDVPFLLEDGRIPSSTLPETNATQPFSKGNSSSNP